MLFMDYRSIFNTIVPSSAFNTIDKVVTKLRVLGLIHIDATAVERVSSLKFLSVYREPDREAYDRKALQQVVKTAQHVTEAILPPIQDIHSKWCLRKSHSNIKDPTHPSHRLFTPLPSGRWYRSIGSQTNRFRDSF
jgi:hypothetical protein